ncbi:MAG: sensor histidine kinase [Spirochaetales bacterium]|nr:sensor histidine kinase [Spirochaetales bacterium]
MVQKSFRNYTRLIILTFFLASNGIFVIHRFITGFMRFRDIPGPGPDVSFTGLVLVIFAAFFWYAVELVDFFRWNYAKETWNFTIPLFMLRLLPFMLTVLVFPSYMAFIQPTFFLVTAFYCAVYIKTRPGLVSLLVLLVFQLFCELYVSDTYMPPEMRRNPDFFFIIYKMMTSILAWLIGFFWKQDRQRWQQIRLLNDELQMTHTRLREYADQVADTVILEERNRLARDIHDSLGHNLTAASIQLSKAEGYFRIEPDAALEAISEARNCLQEGMKDVREVVGTLDDQKGNFDIIEQIRKLAGRIPDDKYTLTLETKGVQKDYNRAVLLAIYRLVQEGLTNIIRHADAGTIRISVTLGSEHAHVLISDNGRGFNVNTLSDNENSTGKFGLRGLKNRIELVRGTLTINSYPGQGTRIEGVLPRVPTSTMKGSGHE